MAGRELAAGLVLEKLLYHLVKARVGRPRPAATLSSVEVLMLPPDEFSFPSGHTAAAVVAVLSPLSPALLAVGCTMAVLIGVSRVYLGVHCLTDVLAGAALGSLSGAGGRMMF